jgi:pimeloyl-ACP methyl ester carboxylesterase
VSSQRISASRRVQGVLLGLLLAALSSGCGGSGGSGSTAPPSVAAEDSSYSVPSISPSDLHGCGYRPILEEFRCSNVKVPLIRRDPSLGRKRIAFAVRPAPHGGLSGTPIFAVEGGPGYASSRTEPAYTGLFRGLLRDHPLVLVDMRGTGRSHGLSCPSVQEGQGPEFITVGQCARSLGPKFEAYTTAMAADDINDVRRALGYGKIALYGDSYGTFLGQSYAFRHPDTLRALVLDSAYPARGESAWYPSLPKTGIRSYAISCERAPNCPGDPAKRLARLANFLRSKHRGVGPLIDAIGGAAYGPPQSYLAIDRAGRALLHGNPNPWRNLTYDNRAGYAHPEHYSHTDELVVGCNDYPMIWQKHASFAERLAQLEHAIRTYPHDAFKPFTPREIAYSSYLAYNECLTWPQPTANYEPPISLGEKPTRAPVLVVSGELDDTTTVHEGQLVAAEFPDARQYVARNVGHVASLYDGSSPPARQIRAFLRNNIGE